MLWYKSWLDTRWRFLIGFVLLTMMACSVIVNWQVTEPFLPILSKQQSDPSTLAGRILNEAIALQQNYRGFVWFQWFRQNLLQMGTLFAILLGSGSVISSSTGGLFTLSLPPSRNRWVATRAATGLGEFFILTMLPSLAIPLLSPIVGEHYGVIDVVAHGLCIFVAAAVFYSLAFLLSTIFNDIWRPLLIAFAIVCVVGYLEMTLQSNGLFRVMAGRRYFESGSLPWIGLSSSAAVSVALLYGAAMNVARKDF